MRIPQWSRLRGGGVTSGFVHFWSGAAGTDLIGRSKTAFGWTDAYEAQLRQARADYPGLPYRAA